MLRILAYAAFTFMVIYFIDVLNDMQKDAWERRKK